jgi:hypothetical protein
VSLLPSRRSRPGGVEANEEDDDANRCDVLAHDRPALQLRRFPPVVHDLHQCAEVGTIARNSVLDLRVPSGPVTIEARLDWGGSQPLTIQATSNRKIEVEVFNTWGAWLAIWGVTLGYRRYLTLRQLPTS